MRAYELFEEVSSADTIDNLINWSLSLAKVVEPLSSYPLLFREFTHNIKQNTALIKVINDRGEYKARQGENELQPELLQELGIKYPVFCVFHSNGTQGVLGKSHIVIPLNYNIFWSPIVEDLGGNRIVGKNKDNYGSISTGNVSTWDYDKKRMVGKEFASTYKEGWPDNKIKNELILDCKEYYMLNLRQLLTNLKFDPTKYKYTEEVLNRRVPEFKGQITTYGDVVEYLTEDLPNYLNWYKKNFKYAKVVR
jgi:hypothetical protein